GDRASLRFSEITRVGPQKGWKEEPFKDMTAGLVCDRRPEALGIALTTIAPFRIRITGLSNARAHRRADNAQRMYRVKSRDLQFAARCQRLVRRRRVRDRGIAGVLLRIVGRSLLRVRVDAAAQHCCTKYRSHSVLDSDGIQPKERLYVSCSYYYGLLRPVTTPRLAPSAPRLPPRSDLSAPFALGTT